MVSSLDGYIASTDGSISWMQSTDSYEKGVAITNAYIDEFLASIDCYVMGAKTYEHALELGWPYGDKPVIVLTRRELTSEKEQVRFFSGDLQTIVNEQLRAQYRNIWMVGGAMLTRDFLRLDLADELVLSVMPVILGGGTPFFDEIGREIQLHLKNVVAFTDGMVEMTYEINKEKT